MTHGVALALVVMLSCSTTCFGGCSCSPSAPPADAGPRVDAHADSSAMRPDTGLDGGPGGTLPPLAPCSDTSECASAPGVACLTDVPGGSCTRRCTTDSDCGGAGGACVLNLCFWGCTSGAGDCIEHAGACLPQMDMPAYCVPICYPAGREPADYPSCAAGLVCDPYTSTCTSTPSTGAENGAPCHDGIECRGGECLVENSPMPTGFLDGMCVSYGVEPSSSLYVAGERLPEGSCPDGSAVIPGLSSSFFGDLAVCFPTCASDGECRAGYACTHFEATSPPFADGLCMPIDCTTTPCPSGATCADASSWLGHQVCTRTP